VNDAGGRAGEVRWQLTARAFYSRSRGVVEVSTHLLAAGPGDVTSLPSGDDAWIVGNEPVVVVDWFGASHYTKRD